MQKILWSSAVLLAASASMLTAGVKSGLQVGDKAGAYNVLDVSGPNEGDKLCYR